MSINLNPTLLQAIAQTAIQAPAPRPTPTGAVQVSRERTAPVERSGREDQPGQKMLEAPANPPRDVPRGSYLDISV